MARTRGFFFVSAALLCGWNSALGAEKKADAAAQAPAANAPAAQCGVAGRHGTRVDWVETLAEATSQAIRERKLVLLMHLSGNFANEEFT